MESCLFCRIVKGKEPATTVFENDRYLAFLDKYPQSPGHLLLIPKFHLPDWLDLNPQQWGEISSLAQHLGQTLKTVSGSPLIYLKAIGEQVPHLHLHLIPAEFKAVDQETFIRRFQAEAVK